MSSSAGNGSGSPSKAVKTSADSAKKSKYLKKPRMPRLMATLSQMRGRLCAMSRRSIHNAME